MRHLKAATIIAALAASLGVTAAAPPDAAVSIDNFTFAPAEITVAAGTRVVWTNRDDIPHSIVSKTNAKSMKSEPLDTDDAFGFTFDKPGTYAYFCGLHPHMQGVVVVK